MREQSLNPSELPPRMKSSPSTVSRWTAGSLPHIRTLERLQEILRWPLVDPPNLVHATPPETTKKHPAEWTDWEVALQSIALLGRPNTWALVDRALSRIEAQPHTLTKELPPSGCCSPTLKPER